MLINHQNLPAHVQIFPLSEGSFTIDKTKIFVPFNTQTDQLQQRPIGSLLVEVQPFVIVTPTDVILIDTGLGFGYEGTLQIHHNLQQIGIDPASVTKVLMSHLHKDHAGAVGKMDKLGNYHLAFSNAVYYVQKKEFAYANEVGFPSYMVEELGVLENHPQVVWLDGDGVIDGWIQYEITGGHSPFHQVFWLHVANQILFFGGDDAPQLQQMKSKFVAKYDFDGKKCMELRQEWWKKGNDLDWTFLFYHDIAAPIYPLV